MLDFNPGKFDYSRDTERIKKFNMCYILNGKPWSLV
jgi:hypothetical protein